MERSEDNLDVPPQLLFHLGMVYDRVLQRPFPGKAFKSSCLKSEHFPY